MAILAVLGTGLAAGPGAFGRAEKPASALAFHAVFHVRWQSRPCGQLKPPGAVACDHSSGSGVFSLVPNVTESYDLFVLAPSKKCTQWLFTSVLTVPHRGTINVAVRTTPCVDPTSLNATGTFVIGGGTGYYAGATGLGTWASTDGKMTGKDRGTATDVFNGSFSLAD